MKSCIQHNHVPGSWTRCRRDIATVYALWRMSRRGIKTFIHKSVVFVFIETTFTTSIRHNCGINLKWTNGENLNN